MVHELQELSPLINRKPIERRLAFQAKDNNKIKHVFVLKILHRLDYKKYATR